MRGSPFLCHKIRIYTYIVQTIGREAMNMQEHNRKQEILRIFSMEIRSILKQVELDFSQLQEIRLRVNAPMLCVYRNQEYYVSEKGELTRDCQKCYMVNKKEIQETMEYIGNYSLYAYEEEVRQGFITIQGGHRVGIAGKAVVEQGRVRSLKYISFLNIRFSHEIRGCADLLMPYLSEGERSMHTLIVSPPRCGKTTLLRDCIRQLSNGTADCRGKTIGVVDERSEIGGSYLGIPQNDLGIRTDVLDCCPKTEGILMLVRSMAPQIIAVDEIGSQEEARAIETALYTGCSLLATIHGNSIEDLRQKPTLKELLREKRIERYVLLSNAKGVGTIEVIYDREGKEIYRC